MTTKESAPILIVEDDAETAALIGKQLSLEGWTCAIASHAEDAIEKISKARPLLILLDLILPGMEGIELCRALKANATTEAIPIIVVSAQDAEEQIIAGLNSGADDYLTKPFSPAILVARIQSVLRRIARKGPAPSVYEVDGLRLDTARFEAILDGSLVELGASEFRILQLLLSERGKVLTREQIIETVHGKNYPVTSRSVDVQIVGLRKKLASYGQMIETVRGVGYRFTD